MTLSVSLSSLACSRSNVRRVKPALEAHRRMVASIRAYGLIEPLVIRRVEDSDHHEVIDGERRLAALRVIYRGEDPKIECTLKKVDADTARAISLSANFTQEHMHPLDEAEAFARLASVDCKGVTEIASEFGVSHGYIRQRMRLAGLAEPIKAGYRVGEIDTGTAEAFASVPMERQMQVWQEVGSKPTSAQHIRTIIEEDWIDAGRAFFDPATLPPSAVTSDLFAERVLIERSAFMEAQQAALTAQRDALTDDGWSEVMVAERSQVQDRLYRMEEPKPAYDAATVQRLQANERRRDELAESECDEEACDALDREEEEIVGDAEVFYDEATKANATVFLLLDPDGRVHTEYRLPRQQAERREAPQAPTSEQLSDGQQAAIYTQEALAVREAVADQPLVIKRLLILALHDKVHAHGLAVRSTTNVTTGCADRGGMCRSDSHDARELARREIDPFAAEHHVDDAEAYRILCDLKPQQLDHLIEVLTVGLITAQAARPTPLIGLLCEGLMVNIREHWRPDASWLAGYKKCQLAHLIGELRGTVYVHAAKQAKKSELVENLAKLFADAASGELEDKELAERVNRWLPISLREAAEAEALAAA